MQKNTDQNNSEYVQFSRSDQLSYKSFFYITSKSGQKSKYLKNEKTF